MRGRLATATVIEVHLPRVIQVSVGAIRESPIPPPPERPLWPAMFAQGSPKAEGAPPRGPEIPEALRNALIE